MTDREKGYAATLIAACILTLAGCGGGGADTATTGTTPTAQVQGIATPSGVSVVTATNAQ